MRRASFASSQLGARLRDDVESACLDSTRNSLREKGRGLFMAFRFIRSLYCRFLPSKTKPRRISSLHAVKATSAFDRTKHRAVKVSQQSARDTNAAISMCFLDNRTLHSHSFRSSRLANCDCIVWAGLGMARHTKLRVRDDEQSSRTYASLKDDVTQRFVVWLGRFFTTRRSSFLKFSPFLALWRARHVKL